MKKVFMLLAMVTMLVACSSENSAVDDGNEVNDGRCTEVYVMGKEVKAAGMARAAQAPNYVPAYYFVRIDGRIPKTEGINYSTNDYWPYDPATSSGSVFAEGNKGTVNFNYAGWKMGQGQVAQYVYDTTGEEVNTVLGDVPSFKSMMSVNKKDVDAVNAIDTTDLKIIWYVAKLTYGSWHVDGVLTYKTTNDVTDIPGFKGETGLENSADNPTLPDDGKGNIEVDVHQQEHKDWDEVKTSVHVRDLVEKVVVEIPLEQMNIAETDDFAIRTYDLTLDSKVFINGREYALDSTNPVKVTIEHLADKAVFTIVCTDKKYLAALRKEYNDGVTVEIHTYPKNLTREQVWEKLQQTKVTVLPSTYDRLVYKGATSAFFNN